MLEPTLTAMMATTDTGAAEPRLVLEWPSGDVSKNAALAFVHNVIAEVYEARRDGGAGWLVVTPDVVERTADTTTAIIVARTWPRSAAEADDAMAAFAAVAEHARGLRQEVMALSGSHSAE